jgi:hypothetical protein
MGEWEQNPGIFVQDLIASIFPVRFMEVFSSLNYRGVTLLEALDGGPTPISFAAVTEKVQGVPRIRPFTVIGLAGPEAVCPELDVTV